MSCCWDLSESEAGGIGSAVIEPGRGKGPLVGWLASVGLRHQLTSARQRRKRMRRQGPCTVLLATMFFQFRLVTQPHRHNRRRHDDDDNDDDDDDDDDDERERERERD